MHGHAIMLGIVAVLAALVMWKREAPAAPPHVADPEPDMLNTVGASNAPGLNADTLSGPRYLTYNAPPRAGTFGGQCAPLARPAVAKAPT
jgi:hypothetical protein